MGQVTIEIPQNVNRSYRINDSEFGEQLLQDLEDFKRNAKSGNGESKKSKKKLETVKLVLPYDDLDEIDENEVLGIWADNVEDADEIARRVREQNRGQRE